MTRTTRFAIAAAVLVGAAGLYLGSRPPRTETVTTEVSPSDGLDRERDEVASLDDVSDITEPAAEDSGRTEVEDASADFGAERAATHVLRVTVDGIDDEELSRSTVTLTSLGRRHWRWPGDPRASWACEERTSEFDLGPFLASVADAGEDRQVDRLNVQVTHPHHLSETVQVPLADGVEDGRGRTVYEARVEFAEVLYWPEFTLSVRDAATRAHLEDVELRIVPTAFMGLMQQPGDGYPYVTLGTGLRSPIALVGGRKTTAEEDRAGAVALVTPSAEALRPGELDVTDPLERGVMFYARAPGHAWGRAVIDVSKSAERVVLLGSSATLDLRLSNVQLDGYAALDTEATLRIVHREEDGSEDGVLSRSVDLSLETDGVRLEGLVPGEHVVTVQLGDWNQKPAVLATEEVRLAPGETREVVLALPDAPAPPERATIGGVVAFPKFGGEDDVRLQFFDASYRYGEPTAELALVDMERIGGVRPTWSFRVDDLPEGVYEARLVPFLKSWMVDLPATGREDLELVLPELAEVLVEAVDARSGERIPLEELRYGDREELPGRVRQERSTVERATVAFDDEPGRFRIWSAPGPAFIGTWRVPQGVSIGSRTQDVELVPGLQTVRFELAPPSRLSFEFRVDGDALPTDDPIFNGLGERIRGVDHDGRARAIRYWLFELSAPGLYEIDFEGIGADRFLPIPTRRVEAGAGKPTEVIVDLRRK